MNCMERKIYTRGIKLQCILILIALPKYDGSVIYLKKKTNSFNIMENLHISSNIMNSMPDCKPSLDHSNGSMIEKSINGVRFFLKMFVVAF